jgi:F-type H+-transporting ATPase subunit b
MLNFGIVLGALTYLLLKPVRRILEERAARVAQAQKAAEETIKEKAAIEELKEKALKEARAKAKELTAEVRTEVDKKREEWLAEAKQEVVKVKEKAQKALVAEKAALLDSMKEDFAEAVFAVAGKVLGAEISAKQHAALINQGLKEIAAAK